MHKKILIPVLFLLFATACKKEPQLTVAEQREKDSNGTLTAMLNGQSWSHPISIFDFSGTSGSHVAVTTYKYEGKTEREVFYFNTVNLALKGKQKIYRDVYAYKGLVPTCGMQAKEGNVVENAYIVDSSTENYVQINSYDPATGEVDGVFQVGLYRELAQVRDTTPGLPNNLLFTEGKFHAKLK